MIEYYVALLICSQIVYNWYIRCSHLTYIMYLKIKERGTQRVLRVNYMWYVINQDGERIAVESKEEAVRLCSNDEWYVSYIYSNCGVMF